MPNISPPAALFNKSLSVTAAILQGVQNSPYRVWASHSDPLSAQYLATKHHFVEPKHLQGEPYARWLLQACLERGIGIVVAGKARELLADWRPQFAAQGVQLITASDRATQELLEDKVAFLRGWDTSILPIPRWTSFESAEEFERALTELQTEGVRLCLKPARGIFASGFRILQEKPDLQRFLQGSLYDMSLAAARELFAVQPHFAPMLLMHTLEGPEHSVDCVAWEGELLAAVVRRKGEGRQWIQDRPDLQEVARRVARTYGLSGIFNFQTKDDLAKGEGTAHMLEINARPSGGLRYSMKAGVNFGRLLLDAACGQPTALGPVQSGFAVVEERAVRVLSHV